MRKVYQKTPAVGTVFETEAQEIPVLESLLKIQSGPVGVVTERS